MSQMEGSFWNLHCENLEPEGTCIEMSGTMGGVTPKNKTAAFKVSHT